MLREARIVMPHFASLSSQAAHHELQQKLCAAFGGFTSYQGHGGWVAPDGAVVQDMVTIYDVAIDDNRDAPYELIARFAVETGKALDQTSVYVRYPNGEAELIDVSPKTSKADRLLDVVTKENFVTGAERLLREIFGPDAEITRIDLDNFADVGDGRAFLRSAHDHGVAFDTPTEHKELPQPGQLWESRGGEMVFVGRRATVHDGGWYATETRTGFEYVIDLDGRIVPNVGAISQRDLVKRIH